MEQLYKRITLRTNELECSKFVNVFYSTRLYLIMLESVSSSVVYILFKEPPNLIAYVYKPYRLFRSKICLNCSTYNFHTTVCKETSVIPFRLLFVFCLHHFISSSVFRKDPLHVLKLV